MRTLRALCALRTRCALRARRTGTVSHRDVFESQPARAFLREVARDFAARGRMRVFSLRIAGEVVATRVGFVCADHLYLYYSGYDPEWARYSVMTTVVAETMRYAIDQRLACVNLSFGADFSKERWRPLATVFPSVVQVAPGLRPRVAHSVFVRAAQAFRSGVLLSAARFLMRERARGVAAEAPPDPAGKPGEFPPPRRG